MNEAHKPTLLFLVLLSLVASPAFAPDPVGAGLVVSDLRFDGAGLLWNAALDADSYAVYRGRIPVDGMTGYDHNCEATFVSGTAAEDPDVPPRREAFYYLVTGQKVETDPDESLLVGPLGVDSTGATRPDSDGVTCGPRVFVDPDNLVGPHDGLSWATAYTGVSGAVGDGRFEDRGSEIWVRGMQVDDSAWALDTIRPGVRLVGGFAGTENASWERPPGGPATVLDGGGGAWVLRSSGASIALDEITLRNAVTGLLVQPAGNLVDLFDVNVEQITGYGVDLVGQGAAAPRLNVQISTIDASVGLGGIRATSEGGTLGGLIRRNSFLGGFDAALRLQARPVMADATVAPDIVANTISGSGNGIVLGAEVSVVPFFDATNTTFVGSNLIYGTTHAGVVVEAAGDFVLAGRTVRAAPLIVGNTISDGGGVGIRSAALHTGSLSGEVRAEPQLWDNLITFHAGVGIEETTDDPPSGLISDPLVVGNDLFGNAALYRDEGTTDLTLADDVNALPGAFDNYDADPGYVDPALGDYHIRAGTLVGIGTSMLYLANSSDPEIGMSWTEEGFVPAGWPDGVYGVGYDTGPLPNAAGLLQTVVPEGTLSVFTRVSFMVESAGDVMSLLLGYEYDDGTVAWINGVEVFRSASMPGGALEWNTPAAEHESSNMPAPVFAQQDISALGIPALHDGENVLAMGVWNTDGGSNDLVLVPQLIVNQEFPPIDAGHLTAPRIATEDIDGDARIVDGTKSGLGRPDTGADERICNATDLTCQLDCIDEDGDGFCLGTDCDDSNAACAAICTDADGDGLTACNGDCQELNPNCTLDCTDADADGFCVTTDCDEGNPNCSADCSDPDGDGFCVIEDCDESLPECNADCTNTDGDDLAACAGDCDDGNANCSTDCTDADADGYCVTTDCDDTKPQCTTDCTDVDADGFCVDADCDDGNPNCTADCTDADGDGFCVIEDCDDGNAQCSADCTDADGDGFCIIEDCDDGNAQCSADCTDADGDGFCVIEDCDDANPNCRFDCLDQDQDGYCVFEDCNDLFPECTVNCTDNDLDGFCVDADCDDDNGHCTSDCSDGDGDGWCVNDDCDDVNPNCNSACFDFDEDGYCASTDCDDSNPSCTNDCDDDDNDGVRVCDGDCDDSNANCTDDCSDDDDDGICNDDDCNDGDPLCSADCADTDADGFCGDIDCDDGNPNCAADCTDADGDGFCLDTDCDETNPNCMTDCTNTDGDGFCVDTDCDDTNPNCTTNCTDADNDGFCAGIDCDDTSDLCTTNCGDVDNDGLCAEADCNDTNGNCTTDCTDADDDLFCVTTDCDDTNPNCTTDCTDADSDGFCVTTDCDESDANCSQDCEDDDGDGVRICDGDCDDTKPQCTTDCTDADNDTYCVTTDCDDANANCTTDCTDADNDGFCVTTDCDDSNADCTTDCSDPDGDGFVCTADCDNTNPWCTTDCTDADGDSVCVTIDCDDDSPDCSFDCTDADGDGVAACAGDCDESNPQCTSDCTDLDGDGFCVTTDCDDSVPSCTLDCSDADGDGLRACAGDCDDASATCTVDCSDADGDGLRGCDQDCDDSNPLCTIDCTDVDGDLFCVTTDCDDANANCTTDCSDPDGDGFCVTSDCDETDVDCNADCADADGDGLRGCNGDCDDMNPDALPGLEEICADSADNDCNGVADGDDPACADLVVSNLRFDASGLIWDGAPGADQYALYRGTIPPTGLQSYDHLCEATQLAATTAQDPDIPPRREGYYYLVAGQSLETTPESSLTGGPLGLDSQAVWRPDSDAVTCGPRIYVDPDNLAGPHDGLGWATAYTGVSGAVGDGRFGDRGSEVWLRGAPFVESGWALGTIRPGVRLVGGFAGTENASWERPSGGPTTMLDGGGGAWALRSSGVNVVLDELTLGNAVTGLLAESPGRLVQLVGVRTEQITGYGVDLVGQGAAAPRLNVQASTIDASVGLGGIRATSEGGTLGGLIRRNSFLGGFDAALRLQARPVMADATVAPDIVANTISGSGNGIVLGAEVSVVPFFDATNTTFVGSNLIYGTTHAGVVVEAAGDFVLAGRTVRAAPLIVGNTISDGGGVGIRSAALHTGSLSGEVRAEPQLWDNLITFHAGVGIEETTDDPPSGLISDPLVVGNDLFGNAALYRDEGTTDLTLADDVNALPGAFDNYDADPGYVDPALGDYHIRAGTLVGIGTSMLYLANSSDPGIGMSWTEEGFVPAGWPDGVYGVGYDTGPLPNAAGLLQSVVPEGTLSVFTRVSFMVENAGDVMSLLLGYEYDDGTVAWINGVEVFRSASMPGGALLWNTPATDHESSNMPAPVFAQQDISTLGIPALHDGENVLAMGVWNTDGGSSDLVLVPQLIVNQESPPIDAGHLTAPRIANEDIDGDARVGDGNLDGVNAPDTGADER